MAQALDDPVAAGDDALSRGDWTAARDSFLRALEIDEGSGPAWVGLGWASWWLCDEEATFEAYDRAFRAYRAAEDNRGAARAATWLASVYLDFRGEDAIAVGWLDRARRLLEGVPECADHGYLHLIETDLLRSTGGSPAAAERSAQEAVRMGRELGVPDLEAVGLAHLGGAALDQGRVEEGLRLLDQASAIAATEDFQLALSPGWTLCCTITGCEGVGDFARAAQWAGAMLKTGERWQGRHMNAMCRSAYGKVLATRGDWPAADTELMAAVADLVPTRPAMSGGALVKLGELRARQGRAEEARELFGRAGAHPGAVLGLGTMAWKDGDPQAAADAADRVLRRVPDGSLLDRLPALELLALAKAGLGSHDQAAAACSEMAELATLLGTTYLRGRARLTEAEVTHARGDHEESRRGCEDAIDLFAEASAPYERALSQAVLARALRALGRPERAEQEEASARETFVALGAEREVAALAKSGGHEQLTVRELEVLRLVARGLSDAQVAEQLVVSPHTVHRHVANIRVKLGLSSRAAAVAYAARENLL